MLILGIESTCDETAAAVVSDGSIVHSNVVATQVDLHAKYRGVVPEIASRAHIENIIPVIKESLDKAGCGFDQIDAIAIACRPGLIGSLLIGVTAAKTLAWSLQKPLIGADHVHAHLYSVMLGPAAQSPIFPAVGLVISGGHTALYRLNSFLEVRRIGATIDDAVGEAYDKVAAILGLGYPGGPIIDRLTASGSNPVDFPRTMLARDSLDFSFSGLKTAVLYKVRGHKGRERGPESLSEADRANVAAGFQAACVDVIVKKLRRAIDRTGAKSVVVGGGVSANRGLRAALARFEVPVLFPHTEFCTDNAAMSAGLAHLYFQQGTFASLDLDAATQSEIAV